MAGKNKTYELMLKIGGKMDGSLKTACSTADKNLAALGKTAKTAGKIAAAVNRPLPTYSKASLNRNWHMLPRKSKRMQIRPSNMHMGGAIRCSANALKHIRLL